MKNVLLSLSMLAIVNCGYALTQEQIDQNKIEVLGCGFHYAARRCALDQEKISEGTVAFVRGLAYLHFGSTTASEALQSLLFQINEKTPAEVAMSQKCELCDEYAKVLDRYKVASEYLIAEGKGSIILDKLDEDTLNQCMKLMQ